MRMRTLITVSPFVAITAIVAAGSCALDVHDNTVNIKDATVKVNADANVDLNNVAPSQAIAITATTTKVYLIEPTATPPAEHVNDAGHLRVYLDDVATPPVLITAQAKFTVTVPPQIPPGKHKYICRVHKHDGTPTTVTFELAFTVSIGGGGQDPGTPDM